MRSFCMLLCFLLLACSLLAQERPPIPIQKSDLSVRLDKRTGKIDIYHQKSQASITNDLLLDVFELEIYDAEGQYAGSLVLDKFALPSDEIHATENLKIAQLRFKHAKSGRIWTFNNVDFN